MKRFWFLGEVNKALIPKAIEHCARQATTTTTSSSLASRFRCPSRHARKRPSTPFFGLPDARAPGSGKQLFRAALRPCPRCLAVPTFSPSRTRPARAKTTGRRRGRGRLRRSAPCGAARTAADRSRFSRRNKSRAQDAGADLSRKRAGGHRAREKESGWMHGLASPAQRRARTKGGTSSTAPDRVGLLGARAACVCVCSLWEKATRTRYSVERWLCVGWRARWIATGRWLTVCRCYFPQRPVAGRGVVRAKKGVVCSVQLKA